MGKLFVDPAALPADGFGFIQVLFLGACYAFCLLKGSNLISDGSELLLLIPSAAGLVGSVVLPVLGAVPDGAIVLFSGMGPIDQAAAQLSVGVGALAGSTVMLITVPWFLSILGGRVALVRGEPCYSRRQRETLTANGREMPVVGALGCCTSGVAANISIRTSSMVMLATCLIGYLIVELPALVLMNDAQTTREKDISPFAWIGTVLCAMMFVGYLVLQFRIANQPSESAAVDANTVKAINVATAKIQDRSMSLRGVLSFFATGENGQSEVDRVKMMTRLRGVVRPFFVRYDKDQSGGLSKDELQEMVFDLGERTNRGDLDVLFSKIDEDHSGVIDFEECVRWLADFVLSDVSSRAVPSGALVPAPSSKRGSAASLPLVAVPDIEDGEGEEGEEEEEGPELPDDVRSMSPAEQRRWVLMSSCKQMGLGTLIVLLFSDPMVDVLNALGVRTGVPPFYVAFLLAPLASNASEMIASYKYATQKTQKSITISFAQLLGAACMNNTFCLGIFYALIALRGLDWTFHAEVFGIIMAEMFVVLMARRRVHMLVNGAIVLSMMPLCLVLVFVLKATVFKGKEN